MLLPDVSREVRGSPFGRSFAARYAGVMPRLFRAKLPAGVIDGIGVIAAAVSFPLLEQQDLLPEFHETDQLIHWDAKPGTSRPEMTRITTRVAHELRAIPGVRSVGGHIGRAVNSDQIVGVNSGELWINIDPKADYKATLRAINSVLDSYPGMESEVSTYTAERIAKIRGVDKGEVVVRIYGRDSDVLAAEAKKIKSMCSDYDCRLAAQMHQTGEGLSVRYRTFKH
jgi:Cu/Ag efflux pump CusA